MSEENVEQLFETISDAWEEQRAEPAQILDAPGYRVLVVVRWQSTGTRRDRTRI
jgi:hypothetical protein